METRHSPTDSLRAAALDELDAHNQGWPCADARAVAFLCLRSLCVRVLEWRHAVGQPCVDAAEVWSWVDDRIDAGTLAWPAEALGVAASARYDLLRKAARLEFDLHTRAAEREAADLFRVAEGADDDWDEALPDTAPWVPGEVAPSQFTTAERDAVLAAPESEKAGTFAAVCLAALRRLRGERRAA